VEAGIFGWFGGTPIFFGSGVHIPFSAGGGS